MSEPAKLNPSELIHRKALELFKKLQGYPENVALETVDPIFRVQTALNRGRWYNLAADVLDTEIKTLDRVKIELPGGCPIYVGEWLDAEIAKLQPVTDPDTQAHPISPVAVESEPAPPPPPAQFPPLAQKSDAWNAP